MFGAFKPELDLPRTEATFKYLILSQPRSGSTMIGSALEASGQAGIPLEYFNPQHLSRLPHPLTSSVLRSYLQDVISRRTTSNGVFGMKIHHRQFMKCYQSGASITAEGIEFLRSFDKFIVISRRDKIAQAISQITARRLRHWNTSEQERQGSQNYEFRESDVKAIAESLHEAVYGEQFWETACTSLKLDALRLVYEEVCASPGTEFGRLADHLGIDVSRMAPLTVKLSRDSHNDAKRKFLSAIGA